jgi:anti-sigma factor RsiW
MSHDSSPTAHSQHDLLLVAALADRELTGEETEQVRAQVAACAECAALQADLVTLAQATRELPPVARPRDFTLRPVDAQRLRPTLVRRILGSFGTTRDSVSRPLAMGLTTLGLAGLLVGVVPGALSLGAGGATSLSGAGQSVDEEQLESMRAAEDGRDTEGQASAAPAAAPDASGDSAAPSAVAGAPDPDGVDNGAAENPIDIAGEPDVAPLLASDPSGVSQVVVISGSFLIIGLGLFALRWTSRRFGG